LCLIYFTARLINQLRLAPFQAYRSCVLDKKQFVPVPASTLSLMHLGSNPDSFFFIPRISKILRAGTTHYIVTSDRLCGVRLVVPPAANPVNSTCPSAEEVHAGKFNFQGLIRSSPLECGARIEIRYRDRTAEWSGRTRSNGRLYFSP
jgi:hypothetical protein